MTDPTHAGPDPVAGRLLADLPDPAALAVVGARPDAVVALACAARACGKRVRVIAVDSRADGSLPPGEVPLAAVRRAAEAAGVAELVELVDGPAVEWPNWAADAVILAGGFDYWAAAADLRAWWPKVRPGGWAGGPGYGVWPGLTRAVDDLLGPPELLSWDGFWRAARVPGRDLRPTGWRPKVGVVTPHYAADPNHFRACLASVRSQSVPGLHYVVCDGSLPAWPDPAPDVRVVTVPGPHHDVGNAARAIGGILAAAEGCDAVTFLDADNWYERDHLAALLEAHARTGAAVVTSGRTLYGLDGRRLGPCLEVDGERFTDTNCLCLFRPGFGLIGAWAAVPAGRAAVGDRYVWAAAVRSGLQRVHTGRPTVNYRTPYKFHYDLFGVPTPAGAKILVEYPDRIAVVRVGLAPGG